MTEKPINSDQTIYILRHGQSNYTQGKVSVREALDLTYQGVKEVSKTAQQINKGLEPHHRIRIISSPFGRTLYTAKILSESIFRSSPSSIDYKTDVEVDDILRETDAGFDGIEISETLSKSNGFQFELVNPLISGGEVVMAGEKFTIDQSKTNPLNLDYHTYLVQDQMKKLPKSVIGSFPLEYASYLQTVETFESVSTRMLKFLSSIAFNPENNKSSIIVVTHGSLIGFLSYIYSGQFHTEIKPGEFLTLRSQVGRLVITEAANLATKEEGPNDIFYEYKLYFGHTI